MSDDMLATIDFITLELGHVTDGDGNPLDDEAIIFFKEDVDGTCEIKVSSTNAPAIAARIVEIWNGRTKPTLAAVRRG